LIGLLFDHKIDASMSELPHITVATVVPRDDRFLFVREHSDGALVYNQPAGHVEAGESLIAAAHRETLEETGWLVQVTALLGVYEYRSPANGISYIRHCFIANPVEQKHPGPLDGDIADTRWLRMEELLGLKDQLRSPMVWRALEDYQRGLVFPLEVIR